jgi:hypothetical protein
LESSLWAFGIPAPAISANLQGFADPGGCPENGSRHLSSERGPEMTAKLDLSAVKRAEERKAESTLETIRFFWPLRRFYGEREVVRLNILRLRSIRGGSTK